VGKIVASYLLKVHLHVPDDADVADALLASAVAPTNDQVKDAIVAGLEKELGGEVSVSLIERTDD